VGDPPKMPDEDTAAFGHAEERRARLFENAATILLGIEIVRRTGVMLKRLSGWDFESVLTSLFLDYRGLAQGWSAGYSAQRLGRSLPSDWETAIRPSRSNERSVSMAPTPGTPPRLSPFLGPKPQPRTNRSCGSALSHSALQFHLPLPPSLAFPRLRPNQCSRNE